MQADADEVGSFDGAVDHPRPTSALTSTSDSAGQPGAEPAYSAASVPDLRGGDLTDAASGVLLAQSSDGILSETVPIAAGSVGPLGPLVPATGYLLPVSTPETMPKQSETSSFSRSSINIVKEETKGLENDDAAVLEAPPVAEKNHPTRNKLPSRGRPRLEPVLPDPLPGQTDAELAYWLQKQKARFKGNLAGTVRAYAFRLYKSLPEPAEGIEPEVHQALREKWFDALTAKQRAVLAKAKYLRDDERRLEQRKEYATKIEFDEGRPVREYQRNPSEERRRQQLQAAQARRRAKKKEEMLARIIALL